MMVRSPIAACLAVVLATCLAVRAGAETPESEPSVFELAAPPSVRFVQSTSGAYSLPKLASADRLPLTNVAATSSAGAGLPFSSEEMPSLQPIPMPEPGQMHQLPTDVPPTPTELRWHHYFSRARSPHRDPNDPQRHLGVGEPLTGTSWRNRPYFVSFFAGGLLGDELQAKQVEQGGGLILGGRFGGDFDHYWGVETRLAFSDLHVNYPQDLSSGKSNNSYFDASLLYYPLGDTRWRPYVTAGIGVAGFKFVDDDHQIIRTSAFEIPWGGGMKYLLGRHVAVRFDLIDNMSLPAGSKVDFMHNISFTGGVEIRFGGRSTDYGSW